MSPTSSQTNSSPGGAGDAEVDLARLDAFLTKELPGYAGPLSLRRFSGGQSNPTYLVTTPSRRYVLRRKPSGRLLASAHAVEREFRVLRSLHSHTSVPVAKPHILCTDTSIIGTCFYVMDYVEGRIFWDTSFPEIDATSRRLYFDAMNSTLAALHCVDPKSVGLSVFGRPTGYMSRQITRWSRQYTEDDAAGRVPVMDELMAWLSMNLPREDESAIVHGDFRCDNMIFHPTEPRVIAIVDWELSTIGHPLADFAYHLMMYRMPTLMITGLADKNLQMLGIPGEKEYVAAYEQRTGRSSIENLDFFVAFSFFRLAAILHGIRGRLIRGTASSPHAVEYARHVEQIAGLGWQQIRRMRL